MPAHNSLGYWRLAALLACCMACNGPTTSKTDEFKAPTLQPKLEGLEGRSLRVQIDFPEAKRKHRLALEAWFVEAMAQSAWLDIASAEESPSGQDLAPAGDLLILRGELNPGGHSLLTTSYQRRGAAPRALAGVHELTWAELPAALDRLALETRRTLGEPLTKLREDSRPCMALVSADLRVAAACGRARELLTHRRLNLADSTLKQALRRDPSCALALSLAAGIRLDLGRSRSAVELARKALALEGRLSPHAAQRVARVLLLAGGKDPERLLELANTTLESRPRDTQALFSRGLALALAGRFKQALPVLEDLRPRLPSSPGLLFALGHARLATGDYAGTRKLLPSIEARVPELATSRLRAWLLLAEGKHEELEHLFTQLAARPSFRSARAQLILVAMRAAHAILRGKDERASTQLLLYLDRLRAQPRVLQAQPSRLTALAWTLARLGKAAEARKAIAALRGPKGFPEKLRASAAFAGGLLSLALAEPVGEKRIRIIEELGSVAKARRLEGLSQRARGHCERALLALRAATPGSDDPALVLEISEVEDLCGRPARAAALRKDLVHELSRPRLDRPGQHPLLRPEFALVLRIARKRK